ncbi:MAG: VOC family protein [Pseudomonadales bacterium]|nr:VOC family protein [Pseudomonadales bacterium]
MTIQLRQICLVACELDSAIDDLEQVFGIQRCFVDPGVGQFGLVNTLLPIGRNFLEVVAPVEANTAAGRYLDRRNGDGGYMVICQADSSANQQAVRQRALDNGVRIAWEVDRENFNICQIHPGDMKAAFFEIDWDEVNDFNGNWHPAGGVQWEDKVDQSVTVDYAAVELQGPDPVGLAELWGKVAGLPVSRDGATLHMALNNVDVRFVEATDGRGYGLGGLDLKVADRDRILAAAKQRDAYVSDDEVDVCGVRFRLIDAG